MKLRQKRKATNRLYSRQADWEAMMQGKSDIVRKGPKGFKKPGSMRS